MKRKAEEKLLLKHNIILFLLDLQSGIIVL